LKTALKRKIIKSTTSEEELSKNLDPKPKSVQTPKENWIDRFKKHMENIQRPWNLKIYLLDIHPLLERLPDRNLPLICTLGDKEHFVA
jgi:hypothetical protein